MRNDIQAYITYLQEEKHASVNTTSSYERDLRKMADYLETIGVTKSADLTDDVLKKYIAYLEGQGKKASTISRSIASTKALFQFLISQGKVDQDPTGQIKAPKVDKKLPSILSLEETEKLLAQPNGKSDKEVRDKAMLELLYATGIRVSELITLTLGDLNMISNCISCGSEGKKRLIPFGKVAKKALTNYINGARTRMIEDENSDILFINCSGEPMSRQGFWKILKFYAKKAGIESEITPHTLRHSFAAHMVSNGADLHAVQEMMGHSDISSTQIYAQLNMGNVREEYQKAHPRK